MVGDGRFAGNSSGYDNFSEGARTSWRFSAGFHANSGNNLRGSMLDLWFTADANRTAEFNAIWISPYYDNNDRYATFASGGSCDNTSSTWTGIRFFADGSTINNCKVELYGIK